ncbi:glycosyltransferase [Riemerella anatipestifer]|uniref:Glycosyl transferase family 2 n=2 Tax=Riemerella anatipestifer TaxID=34085 RepID=E4TA22_RIEAD|nr:glycosyltransferase family 2 protein [Riemerella anatipestifer]ADQ81919.1 glycosyl transferase family 2 [Riemerella anatipestifer ATCC 11845 = DSM 15868]AFD55925.1 glycosyl transferase family 2 [Riemerella anatipestifer ATCC 11845 = DSM 15868]AIH02766.1 glycosyl transferase family 2 [Riemerella anatipestifer CH3]AZZ59806.1 glycosyltransferase [Riemerella anatipestifer]MCO7317933.1 glycosyltransferase [Riemerella anatipestifer]
MAQNQNIDRHKPTLALAIPTYNRPEILKENLLKIINELSRYNIPVYISDDSTNNDTKEIVDYLKKEYYDNIYYYKNTPSLGHDHNCLFTMSLPKEDYIWYIGDSMIIREEAFSMIFEIIENEDYDFICFNAESRSEPLPNNNIYTDPKCILLDLGWHLTMSGAIIYNRRALFTECINIQLVKNFPQLALIFWAAYKKKIQLYWINKKIIYGNRKKESYWSGNQFSVFIDDYKNMLINLPNKFRQEDVDKVVRQHSLNTGIFSYKSLIVMRAKSMLNMEQLEKRKRDIKSFSNANILILFILCLIPVRIVRLGYELFKRKK